LLKAIEPNDALLTLYKGDAIWNIDTRNVCWMLATTDRGRLFDALDTRFTKLNLELYTLAEIARIVQLKFPEWSLDVCQLAARYGGRIPQDALSLAREMALERQYSPDKAWAEIAEIVARRNKIDEFGISSTRLAVLEALGREEAISRPNLCNVVGCKVEEMDRYIMPSLMAATGDCVPLVKVTSRGYALTEAGYAELDKRKISYRKVG
jgi:Holliday junction resolvasome RuvABC ATP-dependent DNA helicase subunit